ncbi:MAG: hypothetical protein LBK53_07345 [Heliobacteriaceae bacterium]|jgi:uncharacterized membrane protein YciS (DUF1049 family)|nr:hypothetical protein [Heliobacteriaceae bacterium]
MNFIYLGIFLAGFAVGAALFGVLYLRLKEKNKAYHRQLERTSVASSSNSSKVEILESKIKVLEKALEDALKS